MLLRDSDLMNLPTSRFWRSGHCAADLRRVRGGCRTEGALSRRFAPTSPRVWARFTAALLCLFLLLPQMARSDEPSAEQRALSAAQHILDAAKGAAAKGCDNPSDVLVRVVCDQKLRVGLRTYYPGFSERNQVGAFSGYEPDIGRQIAEFLGVTFVPV